MKVAALLLLTVALACAAQDGPDPAALMAAQREAMAKLAFMDGVWRGPAWTILASGQRHDVTQTVKDGAWTEVGDRIEPGKEPLRLFEMRLWRVGDSDWPGAGATPPT